MTKPVQVKPVKAYTVATNDPEESTIQFATTNVAARRQGADAIGADFTWVSCKRAPWADQYAGSFIPAQAYIENGWQIGCTNCSRMVSDEHHALGSDGYETDELLTPVFDGDRVFCDASCKDDHEKEVAARNAKFEDFKKAVAAAQPGLTFKDFTGGYPWCGNRATFTFPGAQYGGSVSEKENSTTLEWYVANGDREAWDAFQAQRAA
ncbi:hypothetical protein [Pseudomonas sp. Snoq117.2]|uniref:hypothetical protein n=1 Tax=Pseudomonas sp. Snoq117.2 TaxID=1500302 RepID=UPI0008B7F74C|nr:hypothetical protein [Pseudomonas sp. Snoq117.2]SEO64817.1 hypothetical protein SAMN02787149_101830 [Pseudomonas sp. Snoq117.2]